MIHIPSQGTYGEAAKSLEKELTDQYEGIKSKPFAERLEFYNTLITRSHDMQTQLSSRSFDQAAQDFQRASTLILMKAFTFEAAEMSKIADKGVNLLIETAEVNELIHRKDQLQAMYNQIPAQNRNLPDPLTHAPALETSMKTINQLVDTLPKQRKNNRMLLMMLALVFGMGAIYIWDGVTHPT